MGVRGLQTFIENECPGSCKYVSIKQLADEHRLQFHCEPVLVVDGSSMLSRLYLNSKLEWIYGGQWLQFEHAIKQFIAKFHSIGVKLVFFFDGTTCASKREEWVRRRVSKYPQIAYIFEEIKHTFSQPDEKLFQVVTGLGTLSRFAIKEMSQEVYQTDREADDVIAEFANKNREVFAILSQDSDFIIYNTKKYLSLQHLDMDTLCTKFYDRDYFAFQYLQLRVTQLPLFACLNGNDIISWDKLLNFRRQISSNGRLNLAAIATNLANVIKSAQWSGDPNNLNEMTHISIRVFGHPSWHYLIQAGLNSYGMGRGVSSPKVTVKVQPQLEQLLYQRHFNCENVFLFNLFCKQEYESSEVLEEASELPSALVYRGIRQRCYGILFNCFSTKNERNSNKSITIKEWCAYDGNNLNQPDEVRPLRIQCHYIPSIEDLWFKSSQHEKLKMFWAILQIPMPFNILQSLPKNSMVLSCILSFLIGGLASGPLLQPREVAVFIAQALLNKTVTSLKRLAAPRVDAAAVNLTTLFMRGVTVLMKVLSTCDLPLSYALPWYFFDGKLFHHLYAKMQHNPSLQDLCGHQESTMKEFLKILNAVTVNTEYDIHKLDWRNIFTDFQY